MMGSHQKSPLSESHRASDLSDANVEHAFRLLLPESSLCRKDLSHPHMGENSPQGESSRTTANLASGPLEAS